MKKHLRDVLVVSSIFIVWRSALYGIENIAFLLWPMQERFLGVLTPWANADGVHYTNIASLGYAGFEQAFFPLYPISIRIASIITGLPHEYAALVVSHCAFIVGIFLFWKYLEGEHTRPWTIAFLLVYPASFFFAAAYSESIFFAFAAGALLAAKRKRWLLAGIMTSLASATRLVGIFLYIPMIRAIWKERSQVSFSQWIALVLAPAGLVVYVIYLWKTSGDPLAFFHVQPAFGAGRSGGELIFLPQVIWRYGKIFMSVPRGDLLYHVALFEFSAFVLGITLLVLAMRQRRDISLVLYGACVVLFPTLTGTLSSMPRYLLAAFPLFQTLGVIRSRWVKSAFLIVFFTILVYAATGFLRGYFIS